MNIFRGFCLLSFVVCVLFSAGRSASAQSSPIPTYAIRDLGPLGTATPFGNGMPFYGSARVLNERGQVAGNVDTTADTTHAFRFDTFFDALFDGTRSADLRTLGGKNSYELGINDSGHVVGYADTADGFTHAFISNGAQTADLGTFGGNYSYAYAVNATAQVTGNAYTPEGNSHAFLYTGGRKIDIGTLGGRNSHGVALNNKGQVVGYADTAAGTSHAFLYGYSDTSDFPNVIIDLGTLGGDNSFSSAITQKADDKPGILLVTGSAQTSTGAFHAFASGKVFRDIPVPPLFDLGTLGGSNSYGNDINRNGYVAGNSERADGTTHAFVFGGRSGVLNDLGDLGGGFSFERALNDGGYVVGTSKTSTGAMHAFLFAGYYSGGKMIDLNDVLPSGSGWELLDATAINCNNQIVGSGRLTVNGVTSMHRFLLTEKYFTFYCDRTAVQGYSGETVGAHLVLPLPAPGGGVTFAITSNTNAALIPPTVTVPAGQTRVDFSITTPEVSAPITSTIRAAYGGVTRSVNLTSLPIELYLLDLGVSELPGGAARKATVALNAPAPAGGAKVYIYSNTAAVLIPATVTIPAGEWSQTFTVKTTKVSSSVKTTLKASYHTSSVYAFLTVKP